MANFYAKLNLMASVLEVKVKSDEFVDVDEVRDDSPDYCCLGGESGESENPIVMTCKTWPENWNLADFAGSSLQFRNAKN
jgi:hypothetical protein